jgi:hypothetical protein
MKNMRALILTAALAAGMGAARAQQCQDLSARSEWIGLVCYDQGELLITMQGARYVFCGVPESLYRGLISASSPGTYYDQYIRGRYRCAGW